MGDESSTNAVLEVEGAEPTPGASQTPPEGSPAKDGETKPGKTPPAEGKSSQETPPPDDSLEDDPEPEKGKDVPHGQWLRMKESRNKIRDKLQELSDLGINSREDAEALLEDAKTAESEARQKGIQAIGDWIAEKPEEFISDLNKKRPDVYRIIACNGVADFADAISGSNRELADQITAAAQEFFGNDGKNGRRAPQDSGKSRVSQELASIQQEKQALFDKQASARYISSFNSRLAALTKGLNFGSDERRNDFFEEVLSKTAEALGRNEVFVRQWERIGQVRNLSSHQLEQRIQEAVDLHLKHATNDLIQRIIEKTRVKFGVLAAQKLPGKNGDRVEVTGSGAPPTGKGLTQEAKDKAYDELSKKFSGYDLDVEYNKYLSKAKIGA